MNQTFNMHQFMNDNSFFLNLNKINTELSAHKNISPFIIQKIVSTGNLELVKNINIKELGKQCISEALTEAKNYIISLLKNYKQYDLHILKIDLENRYNLKEKEIHKALTDLEGIVQIKDGAIFLK